MPHRTEVLVVGDSPCQAAGALLDQEGFVGRVRAPDSALGAFEESHPDCVVVCGESLPSTFAAAVSESGCPIVDCAGVSPPARGGGDLVAENPATSLATRVRATVDGTPNRERVARLHEGSAELIGIEDRTALHRRIVEIGSEVLGFGVAVLYRYDGEAFRLGASTDTASPETIDPDTGILAAVRRTGEPAIIDDIDAHPVAEQRVNEYQSGIAVPFGDVGVFGGLSPEPRSYDAVDLEFAQLLANHGAQVDARIRAEESLRERQSRITRLHEAAPSLIGAEDESVLFERVVDIAEDVLELDQSVLLMEDDGQLVPIEGRTHRLSSVLTDTHSGILGRTFTEKRSFLVDDADANPDAEPANESVKSAISIPVGEWGVFQVFPDETGTFDEGDLELAELLVGYAEASYDRIHSEAALRESRRVIERLHTTAMELTSAETESELLERAVAAAEDVLDLDMCKLDLREGDMLVPVAESGGVPEGAGREMHVSEGLAGKTARTGESFLIDDLTADAEAEPTNPEFRSAISVPIGDLGVFQAVATEPAAFDDEDVDLAELLMAHVAVSLRRLRAEADLRTQRDSLEALFENIPGAAVAYEMIDGEPIVRRVNGAFERTFGYDGETVMGESLDDFIVSPEAEESAEAYNRTLAEGERVQAEVQRQTTEGPKHFLLQVTPLKVGEESAPGYAIYSDVTEQREREAELRRQNERLDQFASVVSHDLRNPLNVASGYLDLARETGDESHFDRIEHALERMDDLVTDLLTLAREGQDVGETHATRLDDIAHQAWGNVATAGASLQAETDRTVDADPERLVELFENLYRNSVDHAGDAPTVTVGDLQDNEGFYVADDGPGIDPGIDPFDTGVTTSEEGTGFGLAIVQSIAEAHGWSVSATESESGGARFEFETE